MNTWCSNTHTTMPTNQPTSQPANHLSNNLRIKKIFSAQSFQSNKFLRCIITSFQLRDEKFYLHLQKLWDEIVYAIFISQNKSFIRSGGTSKWRLDKDVCPNGTLLNHLKTCKIYVFTQFLSTSHLQETVQPETLSKICIKLINFQWTS